MLFITNRKVKIYPGEISFDLEDNAGSNEIYFCRRDAYGKYVEIGSESFMHFIRTSNYQQVMFYIHGFSAMPEEDVFANAKELQRLFDLEQENLIEIVPIIWPCDNDMGVVKDYWDDQKSADQSAMAFSRALAKFIKWRDESQEICTKYMNVLAHSMGNRVLENTVNAWCKYDLNSPPPLLFRNIFMVAADIVNEALEYGKSAHNLCNITRNLSVYHAFDDLALRASKISNLRNKIASKRLGHTGPENMNNTCSNVYAIDCDEVNSIYDPPLGHSYFLCDNHGQAGKIFKHMLKSLTNGRVTCDEQRRHILT